MFIVCHYYQWKCGLLGGYIALAELEPILIMLFEDQKVLILDSKLFFYSMVSEFYVFEVIYLPIHKIMKTFTYVLLQKFCAIRFSYDSYKVFLCVLYKIRIKVHFFHPRGYSILLIPFLKIILFPLKYFWKFTNWSYKYGSPALSFLFH